MSTDQRDCENTDNDDGLMAGEPGQLPANADQSGAKDRQATDSNGRDDDQQGLGHLAEHMAFNGTKHFEKQELIDYLESIGMQFGPEVNAYISFDETVYMLQVPTDSSHYVEKGFQILNMGKVYVFDK